MVISFDVHKIQCKWITPFMKQTFVVLGASINISQIGMVLGLSSSMLPQLEAKDSSIPIDDSSGFWIASLPGFALLIGNIISPTLMAKLGGRKANLISVTFCVAGWACLVAAQNIIWILVGRLFLGVSTGMSSCLTSIIIAEVSSPRNRGAFTALMSLIMAAETLTVHTLGSYVTWKTTSSINIVITLVNLLMVALSPETPSWLADQGKHEECRKVFLWLRGEEDSEELNKLIEASINNEEVSDVNSSLTYRMSDFLSIGKKKEFNKSIIIIAHLYVMGQWSGINILTPYIGEVVHYCVGKDANISLIVLSVDIQRVISCIFAVYIIKRLRRRTMLFTCCGANALVFLITAGYVYAKNAFSFNYPVIGILLIHVLMMTVVIGAIPLPLTIAGEIFTLKYRSLSSGITSIFFSLSTFLPIKTFPFLLMSIGLSAAYCIYSVIMIYCLAVAWFLLPETKDRTLQDIEEEFKGTVVDR